MAGFETDAIDEKETEPSVANSASGLPAASFAATNERLPAPPSDPIWLPDPEQVWSAARILAGAIIIVWLVAWPVGTTWANFETTGVFKLGFGYSGAVIILALSNAGLVIAGGYLLRAALRLEATAGRLGDAVKLFEPSIQSEKLRGESQLLSAEVDRALSRLATAEQQIRQQVHAIDTATEALKHSSDETGGRLEKERQGLIEATRTMNSEAEAFAAALAAQSQKTREEAEAATPLIEEQVKRLETVSRESAEQFASLREALAENLEAIQKRPAETQDLFDAGTESLRQAQKDLIEESERLRQLIDQQRERADSLGKSLAQQSEKLAEREPVAPAPAPKKGLGGSWRKILDTVEKQVLSDMLPPKPAPQPKAPIGTPEERSKLENLQRTTLELKTELFGAPSQAELRRFENGERQLFVTQILEHDQVELRARMRLKIGEDQDFAQIADGFLIEFDKLIAPIMAEDPEGAEAALQEMLRSPLGRIYVMIGTAKGHFV